jgi:hypothetical protein
VYVGDGIDAVHTVRKITTDGIVTTLAAAFSYVNGIAVESGGTVYVAHTIRKVTPSGVVTTLAGEAGSAGSPDGTGSAARFWYPTGIAVDGTGALYIADRQNSTIRKGQRDAPAEPAINVQPSSRTVGEWGDVRFVVAATGNPIPALQWQASMDGGGGASWANLADARPYAGATTATLVLTRIPRTLHAHQYRAVATNIFGSVASRAATLAVNAAPADGYIFLTLATASGPIAVDSLSNAYKLGCRGIDQISPVGLVTGWWTVALHRGRLPRREPRAAAAAARQSSRCAHGTVHVGTRAGTRQDLRSGVSARRVAQSPAHRDCARAP